MHMGQLLLAVLLVVIGFLMIVVGQATMQFLGIIVIVIGIGVGLVADLQKSSVSSEH
ncbi:hypothetical protein JZ785_06200 [Alicyclobacillus curvatus]|nr:hypothetical protein JZ785_06200 [Alicyclobacillus curvatus]